MLSDPKLEDSQKKFYYLKILICLNPIIFGLLVIFTDFVDYRGLYESAKYISVAQNWLNSSSNFSERLPLYPLLIAFVFKIFGYNNLLALLIFQSFLGSFTFFFLIKTLEKLKLGNILIILLLVFFYQKIKSIFTLCHFLFF